MRPLVPWSWMAGSVRGVSHVVSDLPRQDHFWADSFHGDRVIAVAMCDGAGSASHGGAGAALAVRSLRDLIRRDLDTTGGVPAQEVLGGWIDETRRLLGWSASTRGLPIQALATTALVAVSDGWTTTTARVGDGFIAARFATEGAWHSLSAPQRGEYACTTSFLTDDLALPVTSACMGLLDGLCVSTDGLEPVAWSDSSNVPHAPFLSGLAGALQQAVGFDLAASTRLRSWMASPDLQARVHDDLTVCMALRISP